MLKKFQPRIALIALVCVGLLLAACTRSASQNTLPTATTIGGDPLGVGGGNQDATMAAIGTEVSAQLTQTAVASVGGAILPPSPTLAPGEPSPTTDPFASPIPPTAGLPPLPTATLAPGVVFPPTAVPPVAGAPCPNPYTVQSGEWIYLIARKCGVAAKDILAVNPGINANYIVPGQIINLPTGASVGATPVPPAAGCTGTRTVVTGDTLFRMSYGCGVTVEQLAAANGITFPYTIFPGQVIRFP